MNVSARNKLKIGLLAIPFWLAVAAAPQAFAQDARSEDEEWVFNDRELDDLIRRIEEEDDGDNDVPTRVRKPKVQAKRLTGWGAKEALRWTINKQAFIEGYLEQAVGELRDPYLTPSSKSEGGLTGNYLWNGFTLNGGFFFTRNYSGTFNTDNVIRDTTYNLGAARKFNLSKDLTLTPSVKYTKLSSSTATKELKKSDASLSFSYALNKEWTLKALTVAYSTQSYTKRVEDQTDKTWTYSTGVGYKWSAKSTFDLSLGREKRTSNQASAEYTRTTITPKYEYKFSPTSSIGLAVGRETRSDNTQSFSRWVLAPKLQLRVDL